MNPTDKWISDAARRATLVFMASYRLKRAIETKDEKQILKTAEKLQESLRQ